MKLFYRIGFLLYVLLLIWVYLNPSMGITSVEVSNKSYRVDYFLHGFAFFILPIVAYLANGERERPFLWYAFIVFSVILALSIEFIQQLVPGRVFNPLDLLSNIIGLIIGFTLVLIYRRIRMK
jgi:VanZ family protein